MQKKAINHLLIFEKSKVNIRLTAPQQLVERYFSCIQGVFAV